MEFSRQESWSGLPFPTPGYCLSPGIKPLASPSLAGRFFFTTETPGKQYTGPASANYCLCNNHKAVINEEVKTERKKKKRPRLKLKKAGKTTRPIKVKVKSLSHVQLFVTPWTAAYQASPSIGFSRQGYWSGVLFPPIRYDLNQIPYDYTVVINRFKG